MLTAVVAFDQRLRRGLTAAEPDQVRAVLDQLRANAAATSRV
jgi:hypothetical protein